MKSPNMESKSLDVFISQARKFKPLSNEEEQELAIMAQLGHRWAMDKLVQHNLLFAIKVCMRYSSQNHNVEDLMGEAVLGMYRAAELYKPVNIRFISYARWWIEVKLQDYVAVNSRTVRPPAQARHGITLIKRYRALTGDNSYHTPAEIREALGIPDGMSGSRDGIIEAGWSASTEISSLNKPMNPNNPDSAEPIDMIPSTDPTPEEMAEGGSMRDAVLFALSCLKPRERHMVQMRYLDDSYFDNEMMRTGCVLQKGYYATLDDIGVVYGVTRERVRQILNESLDKIRLAHGDILRPLL